TVVPETPELKRPPGLTLRRVADCVVLDSDSDSDVEVLGASMMASGRSGTTLEARSGAVMVVSDEEESGDEETERKLEKLQELFPETERNQLLEVIKSTSTLDGAVATCTLRFKGDSSYSNRKRKPSRSDCGSQDKDDGDGNKKRRDSVTDDSEVEGPEPSWKNQEDMVRRLQRKFPSLDK
ncbi:hypothetical protein Z043_108703, partial [Scleropages formosus]